MSKLYTLQTDPGAGLGMAGRVGTGGAGEAPLVPIMKRMDGTYEGPFTVDCSTALFRTLRSASRSQLRRRWRATYDARRMPSINVFSLD